LLDHVPVVAVVGQTNRSAMGGSYQQEVDLTTLFKDVCHQFIQTATVPEQLPNLIDRAMRTAMSERCPTCIIVPSDVQELEYSAPTHELEMVPSSLGVEWPALQAGGDVVERAAEILNSGSRVAILVGQGAREEVMAAADRLGAGVAKALLGKDVLADDLPYVTASIGLLGTRPSYEMMREHDTLLTIGSSFPYTQFMPDFGQARSVQIDLDAKQVGMRYPYELNIVADAKSALDALLPLLGTKPDRSWRDGIEAGVAHWHQTIQRQAMLGSGRPETVNPMRLVHELSAVIPDDAMVASDSGSSANWYARNLRLRADMRGSLSGNLATMGPGVPYVIGAKFAHPDRPAIAIVGDGAMQMNGLAELITISRYWREWSDPRVVVAVLHNNDLNQVTWEMRAMEGAPKFTESQTLPDIDYAEVAAHFGLASAVIRDPGELAGAWKTALGADRPTVLDVRTDPDVPPIPPHADWDQMKNAARAMLSGDEDAAGVIKTGVRHKVQEFVPGHGSRA